MLIQKSFKSHKRENQHISVGYCQERARYWTGNTSIVPSQYWFASDDHLFPSWFFYSYYIFLFYSSVQNVCWKNVRCGSQNTVWRAGNSLKHFITLSPLGRLGIKFFPSLLSWCKDKSISILGIFKSSIQIIVLQKSNSWACSFYLLGYIL